MDRDANGLASFDRRSRAVIFLAPALTFLSINLVVPAVRTILTSFLDRDSEEFVGLDNYEHGCTAHCSQWYCPLAACVPAADLVLGAGGAASAATIARLASDVTAKRLGGVMVWYASAAPLAARKIFAEGRYQAIDMAENAKST